MPLDRWSPIERNIRKSDAVEYQYNCAEAALKEALMCKDEEGAERYRTKLQKLQKDYDRIWEVL